MTTIPQDYESLLALYLRTRRAVDGLRQAAEQGYNFGFCNECDLPYPDGLTRPACDKCRPETYLCGGCMPEGFGLECERCHMATCVECVKVCQKCQNQGCSECVKAASVWRGAADPAPDEFLECKGCYSRYLKVIRSIEKRRGRASRKAKTDRKAARPAPAKQGAVKGYAKAARRSPFYLPD